MDFGMKKGILISALVCISSVFIGCRAPQPGPPVTAAKNYDKPLAPGRQALRKITNPAEIPNFTSACMNLTDLRDSIDRSISYMQKPSSRQFYPVGPITHSQVLASLREFAALLDSGLSGVLLNDAICSKFDVYMSVGCDDIGTVLFTAYYTPIFEASMRRTEKFRYPLYKTPEYLFKA
jgi:membrane-bound lytic murein transglycosylase A